MPHCTNCGEHYKFSPYNSSECCEVCLGLEEYSTQLDVETELDIFKLKNPSGKTPVVFNEQDLEDDSHGL